MSRPAPGIVVTPRLPWPLDDGGRLALWQCVDSVARDRSTTLLSLVPPAEVDAPLPAVFAERGIDVVRVAHRPPSFPVAALAGLFDPMPVQLRRYRSAAAARALAGLVRERKPAFVLLNNLHLAPLSAACAPAATILRQQNVEHRWLERYARGQANPVARAYIADQARRMRRAEASWCARVDLVLAIQEEETRALAALAPTARVETLPFGLPFPEPRPRTPSAGPPLVLLVGTWSWPPNDRGARTFLADGWPALRAALPEARLVVVGKGASPGLEARARASGAGVEWIGAVDSMVPWWEKADVLVVPLWEGAGVRVKIVEGFAAGVPVVATRLAAKGLDLVEGRDYGAAETAQELAAAAVAILRLPDRGRAGGEAARERARSLHSLDAVAERLRSLLDSTGIGRGEAR